MKTEILSHDYITQATKLLAAGDLVAFPTETVYGLGAKASNEAACQKIYHVKGRPADNPLIVHISERQQMEQWVRTPLSGLAAALTEEFWPGPLTLVLPALDHVNPVVRGGLDTVAIRMPSSWIAQQLIGELGHPIAAPSANRSGRPSPTTAQDVRDDLNGLIPLIIDGGACREGVESTVLDLSQELPILLRPGSVTLEALTAVVGTVLLPGEHTVARAPGMKYTHYAPKAPVIWVQGNKSNLSTLIECIKSEVWGSNDWYGIMALDEIIDAVRMEGLPLTDYYGLGMSDHEAAQRLFHGLRELDKNHPKAIFVVWDQTEGLGRAISNRLQKAATRQVKV